MFQRFLDPKNDVAFKKIFGSEQNKDILIDFLNDVLIKNESEKIKDITFLNTVQRPEISVQKQSIIDVLCVDEKGAQYIVEMQVAKTAGFEKRAQYYAAKAYCNQIRSGELYDSLKKVIFLAIVDFVMFPMKKAYKSSHTLKDDDGEHDLKDFNFTFIELPKFTKDRVEDLKTDEEKWYYFFKHADEPQNILRIIANDAGIEKAYTQLQSYNWNEDELASYESIQKIKMDNEARKKQLLDEGEKIGREAGKKEALIETARKMKEQGLSDEMISNITGISTQEIKNL